MALKLFWFDDSFLDIGNSTLSDDQSLGLTETHRTDLEFEPNKVWLTERFEPELQSSSTRAGY